MSRLVSIFVSPFQSGSLPEEEFYTSPCESSYSCEASRGRQLTGPSVAAAPSVDGWADLRGCGWIWQPVSAEQPIGGCSRDTFTPCAGLPEGPLAAKGGGWALGHRSRAPGCTFGHPEWTAQRKSTPARVAWPPWGLPTRPHQCRANSGQAPEEPQFDSSVA